MISFSIFIASTIAISVPFVTVALLFAIHLADIEQFVLGVWCIYCAISLGIISLMTLLVIGKVIADSMQPSQKTSPI